MDYIGRFHLEEKDGMPFQLVYHNPKYQLISQTQSLITSGEQVGENLFRPLFLCPKARFFHETSISIVPLFSSPEYIFSTTKSQKINDHHVVPLSHCNNKEWKGCDACSDSNYGTNSYFCAYCDKTFHKECVESPPKIKHPKHLDHSLQLFYIHYNDKKMKSLCCAITQLQKLVYHCSTCDVVMHLTCAMKSISFVINRPKRHDHPLSLFPRQNLLFCSICSLLRNFVLTYICIKCNFIAHEDCMQSPRIIKISRHRHRISYKFDLQYSEWSCGVCRKGMESDYGAYACEKCKDYRVHLKCALRKDVWDGEDLEGVLEEDDITKDACPFDVISRGVIRYFLHSHNLHLKENKSYNDLKKLCQVCVFPIYDARLYSCMECPFIIHRRCAETPRRIHQGLHPHPLSLKASSGYSSTLFYCNACHRDGGGFVYQCPKKECKYDLDIRCALIPEPMYYEGHYSPLYLALDPEEKHTCHMCKKECIAKLNCIACPFITCFKCSTLPYTARYKHEDHFLRVMFGVKVSEKDWCEICELKLLDTWATIFYWCHICSTTFHVECLFGEEPYLKPGLNFKVYDTEVKVILSTNQSRPSCDVCKKPCRGKLFMSEKHTACSVKCMKDYLLKDYILQKYPSMRTFWYFL